MNLVIKYTVVVLAHFAVCVLGHRPIVKTSKGSVRGFGKTVNGEHISKFLGIPYAKPPTGMRRFERPESPESWDPIVLNASAPKPACPQGKAGVPKAFGPGFEITETNEDCLYLNLFVPGSAKHSSSGTLPVLVFIHGGDFQVGSGSLWDASLLASVGRMIVVTMNFRLGILGFLSTEDSVSPGNWGLLDQRLALIWVQQNIHGFGGDHNRVTIFGHGSGAYSVGLHVLSPMSRGLFARAISQSGAVSSPGVMRAGLKMRVRHLAMMTSCLSVVSDHESSRRMLSCLRTVPASDLVSHDLSADGDFMPTVDNYFIPHDPAAMLKNAHFNAMQYITGGNADEGTIIANRIHNFFTGPGLTESDFDKYITSISPQSVSKSVSKSVKTVLSAMISSKYYPREVNLGNFRRSYLNAVGDAINSKIFETGMHYSRTGKVYVYHFTHKPSDSHFPDYVGPGHIEELQFIFGSIINNGTEDEKKLSMEWMTTWGNFVRTGNPDYNNGSLDWPVYSSTSQRYLQISVNMDDKNVKTNWNPGARRFWNEAIPEVANLPRATSKLPPPEGRKLIWGLLPDAADALFIVMIVVSCFLLAVCAGLVLILYKTNVRQIEFAKKVIMTHNTDTLVKENGATLNSYGSATDNTWHTKM